MASRLLFVPIVALFATAALAQPQDEDTLPEKSVDQIRCELAGDCAELDLAPSAAAFEPPPPELVSAPPAATPAAAAEAPARLRSAAPMATAPITAAAIAPTPAPAYEPGKSTLTINFVANSATFTPDGRVQAERVFQAIRTPQFADKRFLIAGHTNATGARAANLVLSRKRAQALADYFIASGIERGRFDVVGYGAGRPLPGVAPRNSANRRVEISVID